jgi:hypothetical protein
LPSILPYKCVYNKSIFDVVSCRIMCMACHFAFE